METRNNCSVKISFARKPTMFHLALVSPADRFTARGTWYQDSMAAAKRRVLAGQSVTLSVAW